MQLEQELLAKNTKRKPVDHYRNITLEDNEAEENQQPVEPPRRHHMIELNLKDTPGEISHRMESTHSNYSDHYDSHRVMKPKIQLTE